MTTYEIVPVGEIDGVYISVFRTLGEAKKAAMDMAERYKIEVKVLQLISVARVKIQMEEA